MKKVIFTFAMFILSFISFAQTSTYVNGYYRSSGTYVSGYYRTTPDYTRDNNYSTIGNINPYTGEYGTKPGGLNPSYYSSTTSYYTVPTYTTSNYYTIPSYTPSNYYTAPSYTPSITYDFLNYSTPCYSGF